MCERGVEVQYRVSKPSIRVLKSSIECPSPVSRLEVRYRVSRSAALGGHRFELRRGSVSLRVGWRFMFGGVVRCCRSAVSFGGVVLSAIGWRSRQSIIGPGPESTDLVSKDVRRLVLSRRSPAVPCCWCYCYCCRCRGRGFGRLVVGCVWKLEGRRSERQAGIYLQQNGSLTR
jgi:hypothetical protein